ncbi:F-box/kelch-repeat protein At3g23880-like [Trifolium pratense]|uniref:Uncharacterized protein n=2 Tax=Trifolium pratense TaxID=57577 RepID=A0ACB0LMD0_TRIPR|nr:F-box/kelch-repeat protein At3g23880-like [Trifolium pratense]CAJ2669785.1 unnamed protein product [Trifolium pratense]
MSDKVMIGKHQNDTAENHRKPLPFLPDELIFQILLLLPVRILLQLKCVSKSWNTLISNPKFAKSHLQSITMNPTITVQRFFSSYITGSCSSKKLVSFPVKKLLENPPEYTKPVEFSIGYRFAIFGSCNGLLCLFDIFEDYVKLWNPSISLESEKSPALDSFLKHRWISYHGFGYDRVNDKYKALVVLSGKGTYSSEKNVTKIYTFGGNSWKTIQNFPCTGFGNAYVQACNGKFVSGNLNWIIKKDVSFKTVIVSFDLEKETYNEVLLPEHMLVSVCLPRLGVLSNCLCVCFNFKTHLDFWLMKKYGVVESWTRLMRIPCAQIRRCVYPFDNVEPLFIFENGIILLGADTEFLLYNLNNGNLDCPLICYSTVFSGHIYHESLVSPQL